jgi:hypothetical protein
MMLQLPVAEVKADLTHHWKQSQAPNHSAERLQHD